MKPFQNLLQNDNVLCIVIEFDTRARARSDKGSLFGAIAETVPPRVWRVCRITSPRASIGSAALNRPMFVLIRRFLETCG